MKTELKPSLLQCLKDALLAYDSDLNEEQGGFLLKKTNGDEFEFHKVRNQNTGSKIAVGLFTADREEYGDKILKKSLSGKWEEFASFHTHPKGCSAWPSGEDLRHLFTGFPINYIYSPSQDVLMQYTFDKVKNVWQSQQVKIT